MSKTSTLFFHGTTSDGFKFTTAGIVDGDQLCIGISICGAKDAFCKKTGRVRAEGRAKGNPANGGLFKLPVRADGKSLSQFVAVSKTLSELSRNELVDTFNMKSYGQR